MYVVEIYVFSGGVFMDNNEFKNNIPDNEGEIKNDTQNNKNFKEGEEKDKKIFEEEKEDTSKEEKNTEEEAQGDSEEKKGSGVNSSGGTYSANFEPPYYVPNYTIYGENNDSFGEADPDGKKEKKEKRSFGIATVVVLCAVCVLISTTVGAIAGAVAGGRNILEITDDGGKDTINIIRSDRQINVEEIKGSTGVEGLSVAQVAALVGDSVVEITTQQVQTNAIYGQYITSGAGSGVIFSQDDEYGYIVTNYHVIEGADNIKVRVKDGDNAPTDYSAEYLAGDAAEDIAVIRITVSSEIKLDVAVFADSDKLVVGEQVVAIGNPLGQLGGTVTDGIISALDREITVGDNVMTLLQTNAAINPGNSGGGLFNTAGELIGIVNAKQSSTGIEGLGFAIPANIVFKDIEDILEYGYITGRATLGVTVQYGTNKSTGETGVFVKDKGETNFVNMDRIVKIGDTKINSMVDYNLALKKLAVSADNDVTVAVTVHREEKDVFGRSHVYEETFDVTAYENKSQY